MTDATVLQVNSPPLYFAQLTQRKKELEAELDAVKRELAAVDEPTREWFLQHGFPSIKVEVGSDTYRVYIHRQLWASTPQMTGEDADKRRSAFAEAGIEHLLTEGCNTSKLSAWARERQRDRTDGEPLTDPNAVLPVSLRDHISVSERVQIRAQKG